MLRWLRGTLFGTGANDEEESLCPAPSAQAFEWPPVPPAAVILFLDFDGVMHRAENGSFERMPQLTRLLAEHPDLVVVLSTNWKVNADPERLLVLFPAELRGHVVGMTPDLADGSLFQRERECVAWARARGLDRYIALDDDPSGFSEGCPFLVLTDRYVGLDDEAVARCSAALKRLAGR